MSGTRFVDAPPIGELTRLVASLQELVRASYLTQQTMANGLTVNTTLPATTVSGLPASAPVGQLRYATNGRNTGQGAGTGTGCVVCGNGSAWIAVWSGAAVTA